MHVSKFPPSLQCFRGIRILFQGKLAIDFRRLVMTEFFEDDRTVGIQQGRWWGGQHGLVVGFQRPTEIAAVLCVGGLCLKIGLFLVVLAGFVLGDTESIVWC